MHIQLMWPPSIPTYFNAGHRNWFWEGAAYLATLPLQADVEAIDAGVLKRTWASIAQDLVAKPDVLVVVSDFDNLLAMKQVILYCREISPATKIVICGPAAATVPGFFRRYEADAIVASGDWERSLAGYVEFLAGERSADHLRGLNIRTEDERYLATLPGAYIPAAAWGSPDATQVPWEDYNRLYRNGKLEYSGLPAQQELPITISRGCPIGCSYCLVWQHQGKKERRRTVASTLDFADQVYETYPFDYISTYSPTFTLIRDWVMDFARTIETHHRPYKWKTCTTLSYLDEEMIDAFVRSRCLRISVGLETLDPQTLKSLPRVKQHPEVQLRSVAEMCRRGGVELNCFVMLGMPDQTPEGILYTFEVLNEIGARIRPTIYTPYEDLREDMSEDEFCNFTRHFALQDSMAGLSKEHLYELRFGDRAEALHQIVTGIA